MTASLGYFVCSDVTSSTFEVINLNTTNTPFNDGSDTSCFSVGYTLDALLDSCDTLFLLGFNVDGLGTPTTVKISYTFKAYTNCV
jgi:hypothetical protein